MKKLSDFVFEYLVNKGVSDVFMVTGGGIMHLCESVRITKGLSYYCNHHEQASAIAAESYARMTNKLGVCLVTSGPGSTNALSGIAGAWVDSLPVLVISGQVRKELIADYTKLRQFGPQEINIIDMVRPVTKYATTIMDPSSILYELDYACHLAVEGRPGPVWLNIPLDVQAAMIDEKKLTGYIQLTGGEEYDVSYNEVDIALEYIYNSKRPVLLLGAGVRLSGALPGIFELIETLGIPVLENIGAMDILAEDHPLNMGRFGPIGQRRANFTLQNADLILALGASMSVASIGFNTKGFAPRAKKLLVNVDENELHKSSFIPDLGIKSDVGHFIMKLLKKFQPDKFVPDRRWREVCLEWKHNYPTITPNYYEDKEHVNSYIFVDRLSELLSPEAVVITGNSLDIVSVYHSFKVKKGQRVFTNINYGSMGWDLPGALGACVAHKCRETILISGDGTIQFNIQELNTISTNKLPVKIFILNNQGYESIRSTQNNFFKGNFIGADFSSGIRNPDFKKLAEAYQYKYLKIENNVELTEKISEVLEHSGPVICELNLSYTQGRSPKIVSVRREDGTMESKPLEDQFPFLPKEEVQRNMNIFN